MRKLSLCIATAVAFAGVANAQQLFNIFPGVSTFSWRGDIPTTGTGELHQGFLKGQVRGLGDNGTGCAVSGVRYAVQDQNGATGASFNIVFRSGTDATGPGSTTIDIMAAYGPVPFPPAAAGPVAYLFYVAFVTPLTTPCDDFYSTGIEFPAGTPTDFISVHAADSAANGQHPAAADMTFEITYDGFGYATTNPSVATALRMGIFVGQSSFRVGNVLTTAPFTRFGTGGFFPNNTLTGSSSQGLGFHCAHDVGSLGVAFVFMSFDFGASSLVVPGLNNRAYLDLPSLFPIAVGIGAANGTEISLAAPGLDLLPPAPAGDLRLCFQAVVLRSLPVATDLDFTNAVITTFK